MESRILNEKAELSQSKLEQSSSVGGFAVAKALPEWHSDQSVQPDKTYGNSIPHFVQPRQCTELHSRKGIALCAAHVVGGASYHSSISIEFTPFT